jgi:hypothetical protein
VQIRVRVKNSHTREVICAAVTGTLARRPTAVIAGLHADDGCLVIAGRSTELSAESTISRSG